MPLDGYKRTSIGSTREHERQEDESDGGTEEKHADEVRLDDETPCFLQISPSW